jgi:hypothetical protein
MSVPSSAPDFSKLARRPSERAAIVEYIRSAPALQETDFLEWKTAYDLSTKPGRAATSKHLIAFANRDFAQAERSAEGFAYLIVGVELGNLAGVPVWDSADIENWLSPYTGTDLRYGPPDYITVDGVHVLFLVVDPPRPGDPIYCMQKAGADADDNNDTIPEGTIFVRHGGKSERHTSADLRRLTARATAAVAAPLQLSVALDGDDIEVIDAHLLQAATRERYQERERKRLLGSLPRPSNSPFEITLPSFDNRSRDEFVEEVRDYLGEVESRWLDIVAARHVADRESAVVAVIVNDSASNFEEVVLELMFPFSADQVFATASDARAHLAPPDAPRTWGSLRSLVPATMPPMRLPFVPRPEVEALDGDRVLVRYPGIHARPRSRHRLDGLLLALPPEFADTTVDVAWRATSRSTDGDLSGTAALAIPAHDIASRARDHNAADG